MIKLIIHCHSGSRTEVRFKGLAEYTNYLIFNGLPGDDFKHFEVIEDKEGFGHIWKYIPHGDRLAEWNFECEECGEGVLVDHDDIDAVFRKAKKS